MSDVMLNYSKLKYYEDQCKSEMAFIIIVTNLLDNEITELLQKIFIKASTSKDILSPNKGALGSLHTKNQLCYTLGLYPKEIYNDISTILQIRNIAAHEPIESTFKSETIQEKIPTLKLIEKYKDNKKAPQISLAYNFLQNEKDVFSLTAAVLITSIEEIRTKAEKLKSPEIDEIIFLQPKK